ncbi:hypothetical protein AGABI1DRAFT_123980 [Agaricus bisporus var. burnettii JB137-S8]|uniref:Uncharacterized protein n=1 Tax=Agaricus bisporus var. burnettii (strain JB137-S8 / ATCC MYA-4627 / FGSC 10392) TaxID=597362 RepID=K5XJX4_AGABU|nr:uncharacterized protein AGABI1DRAFT_123980 [Agaricus bisporus var. burnettii JB137-S8]EKM83647.1 hypothetical protein AGABI1DRAFT_123980 [Agaricus bisporus var. burnettii JB137-S8]
MLQLRHEVLRGERSSIRFKPVQEGDPWRLIEPPTSFKTSWASLLIAGKLGDVAIANSTWAALTITDDGQPDEAVTVQIPRATLLSEAGNDEADNAGDGTVSGAGNARNSIPSGPGNDGTGKQVARADPTTLARWSDAGQMAVVVPSTISTDGLRYLASRGPACRLHGSFRADMFKRH